MYATVHLCLLACAAGLSLAAPYYHAAPQQRQLFYPSVVPQYSPYSGFPQYVVPAPAPAAYRQVYYAPQSAANLVAPVPSTFRYPTPVKQVLYYPGGPFILAGDDAEKPAEGGDGGWLGSWGSYLPSFPAWAGAFGSAAENKPAESAEKPAEGSKEKPAKEGDKEKEDEEVKPNEEAKVKAAPQKFVVVGQPQFFGNYGLQKFNPAAVIPSADHGAVSSYLLLKNFPGVRFAPQIPQTQVTQTAQDAEAETVPGAAALDYQKLLQASRQQKEFSEDDGAVAVDADQKAAAPEEEKPAAPQADEAEEETGTNE